MTSPSSSSWAGKDAGFPKDYDCKTDMLDSNGKNMIDPLTKQPKFQFNLTDPFKCPFAPDAKCVFADKIFNEDTYETLDILDGMANASNNKLKINQKYVTCVNSDNDGNINITNPTNPTTVKVYEYNIIVPHHKEANVFDTRTYIVNPAQCGLVNFSDMIDTSDNNNPKVNKLYFTGTKGNKPNFTDVTDDYLYNELGLVNMNDQGNSKFYTDLCNGTRASGANNPGANVKVTVGGGTNATSATSAISGITGLSS